MRPSGDPPRRRLVASASVQSDRSDAPGGVGGSPVRLRRAMTAALGGPPKLELSEKSSWQPLESPGGADRPGGPREGGEAKAQDGVAAGSRFRRRGGRGLKAVVDSVMTRHKAQLEHNLMVDSMAGGGPSESHSGAKKGPRPPPRPANGGSRSRERNGNSGGGGAEALEEAQEDGVKDSGTTWRVLTQGGRTVTQLRRGMLVRFLAEEKESTSAFGRWLLWVVVFFVFTGGAFFSQASLMHPELEGLVLDELKGDLTTMPAGYSSGPCSEAVTNGTSPSLSKLVQCGYLTGIGEESTASTVNTDASSVRGRADQFHVLQALLHNLVVTEDNGAEVGMVVSEETEGSSQRTNFTSHMRPVASYNYVLGVSFGRLKGSIMHTVSPTALHGAMDLQVPRSDDRFRRADTLTDLFDKSRCRELTIGHTTMTSAQLYDEVLALEQAGCSSVRILPVASQQVTDEVLGLLAVQNRWLDASTTLSYLRVDVFNAPSEFFVQAALYWTRRPSGAVFQGEHAAAVRSDSPSRLAATASLTLLCAVAACALVVTDVQRQVRFQLSMSRSASAPRPEHRWQSIVGLATRQSGKKNKRVQELNEIGRAGRAGGLDSESSTKRWSVVAQAVTRSSSFVLWLAFFALVASFVYTVYLLKLLYADGDASLTSSSYIVVVANSLRPLEVLGPRRLFNIMFMVSALALVLVNITFSVPEKSSLSLLRQLLYSSASDLVPVISVLLTVLAMYALCGHFMFGQKLKEFRTVMDSLQTCFELAYGEGVSTRQLRDAFSAADDPLTSNLVRLFPFAWLASFVVISSFIIINVFIAIAVRAYEQFKRRMLFLRRKPLVKDISSGARSRVLYCIRLCGKGGSVDGNAMHLLHLWQHKGFRVNVIAETVHPLPEGLVTVQQLSGLVMQRLRAHVARHLNRRSNMAAATGWGVGATQRGSHLTARDQFPPGEELVLQALASSVSDYVHRLFDRCVARVRAEAMGQAEVEGTDWEVLLRDRIFNGAIPASQDESSVPDYERRRQGGGLGVGSASTSGSATRSGSRQMRGSVAMQENPMMFMAKTESQRRRTADSHQSDAS